jgi:hypothetical protein
MKKILPILLTSLLLLSSCSIDWNDEKDKKISELEGIITVLNDQLKVLNSEKLELLIWTHFTPHAASRKITFFRNGTFVFSKDENEALGWTYTLKWSDLTLTYDDKTQLKLLFHKWATDGDTNYYIEWDGEYFISQS